MATTLHFSDIVVSAFVLACVYCGAGLLSWLMRDHDEEPAQSQPQPRQALFAGHELHVVQDVFIDGRIVAHRGELVKLASRVFYRDHGYCWSATSNGRHIFPIPEWALSVDSIQG